MSPDEMRELAITDGNVYSFPELQIVSDEKFLKAHQRLQENPQKLQSALRSPRSRERNSEDRPMLLNGFLFCPKCDNQLVVMGANGTSYGCMTCKFHPVDQQFLYSQMPRRLRTEMVVNAICKKVLSDESVLANCVAQFLVEAERMQKPDPKETDVQIAR